MKTIQIVFLGLLFPLISFAQQDFLAYLENNVLYNNDTSYDKDTIEIAISDNNKIIFIADDLDVFDRVNVDSLFRAVKQGMGGNFINTSDEHITKSFTLDDIPELLQKTKCNPDSAITISIGANAFVGLVRNELSPGVGVTLELNSFRRGGKLGAFLSADFYYFFTKNSSGENVTDINTFINAGLTHDREKLGFGYGIGGGKQIEKPVYKIFCGYSLKNTDITIFPELYFVNASSKNRNMFPGITVKIGF